MESLAVMTAAFWSGLTRKDAKYMLLQEGVQVAMWKSAHGDRVRQPSPASRPACRRGAACSNLPCSPRAVLDVYVE